MKRDLRQLQLETDEAKRLLQAAIENLQGAAYHLVQAGHSAYPRRANAALVADCEARLSDVLKNIPEATV